MAETIQERVRNMVGSFHNMKSLFVNLSKEEDYEKRMKIINYILNNSQNIANTMEHSIKYLIDMAAVVDKYLPKDFDINEELDKSKYQQ